MPDRLDGITEEMLSKVSPRDLQGYVKSQGWVRGFRSRNVMVYNWKGELDQVATPVDSTVRDFSELVYDAIRKLASFEDRSFLHVLTDVLNFDADVLRYRYIGTVADGGSLPLPRAFDMIEGAKKSILAAAHSVIERKRRHARLSRGDAVQFVESCRLGQTERGSFIFTIACPLGRTSDQLGLATDEPDVPFGRQSTMLLQRAIAELNSSIENDNLESLTDSESPIVSANLCEALLKMRPDDERAALEFSSSWAAARTVEDAALRKPVILSYSEFEAIESVYESIEPERKLVTRRWLATVDVLRGNDAEDGRREGEVIFKLFDDDEGLVTAKATLNADQYQTAYESHNPVQPLVVEGVLVRRPRRSILQGIKLVRKLREMIREEEKAAWEGEGF